LADFPVPRYPRDVPPPPIWAPRNTLTAVDAVYVVLAEALDTLTLTRDRRSAAATRHRARVEGV
jgi:predicted nucleic acid-binding protein